MKVNYNDTSTLKVKKPFMNSHQLNDAIDNLEYSKVLKDF